MIFALSFLWLFVAVPTPEQSIRNFGRVDDHILRGAVPDERGLRALAAMGVKTVVDLRPGNTATEKRAAESLGMQYINVPMPGLHAPDPSALTQALTTLDDQSAWPVFVHCVHGRDRTGTVVACYRIRHDHWDSTRALDEARHHGLSLAERGMIHTILSFEATP